MTKAQEWLNANVPNINQRGQIVNLQIYAGTGTNSNQNNAFVFYNTSLEDELNLNEFVNLQQLYICGSNTNQRQALTGLKVDKCVKLNLIHIVYTNLVELDLEKNSALNNLNCNYNQLVNLNLEGNPALQTLNCQFNKLTSINVSKAAITNLYCQNNNQLSSLDLSKNTKLVNLQKDAGTDLYTTFMGNLNETIEELKKEKEQAQRQLKSLIDIIKPNNSFANTSLKSEVEKIEEENLTQKLENMKIELEKLIGDAKKYLNEDLREWLETLLEAQLEILKTNNPFAKKQLEKAERILTKELPADELRKILDKQKEVKSLSESMTQ
ncbi:17593_t:CDS:1 [Funneliformis geosporum]|uniref:12079_t:CDS:1 n=1 Tax=Funneliformis geosporum TaxID=1117311 RepID=A0A9W4SFQ2_9GLOM|nr:12079_t:CDS:1 [Funneliformis geosporum]CAI2170907.1 17593_t:CDS:1 [Funneliformis geosporum]